VSTALGYIPETSWNDTPQSNTGSQRTFSASGGGASTLFSKPSWQTGTGVPPDGHRDVPDIAITSSNFNDPYLVCSEDGDATPCASGFRDSVGGNFFAVGGTSAAAPTFSAILALVNQFLGSTGLAPVNPTLYSLAASNPSVFHDITTGDNKVPCTAGTTNCPTGTTSIGFSAGTGYDQVKANGVTLGADGVPTDGAFLDPISGTYAPVLGDLLFIVNNTQPSNIPIVGTFYNRLEGSEVTVNGISGFISYKGDFDTKSLTGGNDVVLYGFNPVPEPGSVLAVAAGALAVLGGLRRRLRGEVR
jgi:hypothetical protein